MLLLSQRQILALFVLLITAVTNGFAQDNTAKADSLRAVIAKSEGLEKGEALEDLFYLYFPRDIEAFSQVAEELEALAEAEQSNEILLIAWEAQSRVYNYQSKYDSTLVISRKAVVLAKKTNSDRLQRFYNDIGIYHEKMGMLDSSVYYYELALAQANAGQMALNNNLGRIYLRQRNYFKSLEFLAAAMKEAKVEGNLNAEAVIANNIGLAHSRVGNPEKAEEYYLRSVELKEQIGDQRGKLFALSNLVYDEVTGKINPAYIEQGLKTAHEVEDSAQLRTFQTHLSGLYNERGEYQKGIDQLYPIYLRLKDNPSYEYRRVLNILVQLFINKGELDKAEEIAKEGIRYGKANDSMDDQLALQSRLLEVYQARKDYQRYFELAATYYPLRDSIEEQTRIDRLAYLDAQLDREQQDKIELLNLTIAQKETSRYWIGVIAVLVALILSLLLYFRIRQIRSQKATITREKESAQKLEQMNEKLRGIDQLKSRLYTNITHEFRTPLTVILGMAEQLKAEQAKDADHVKKLQLIRRNGHNLLDLINQLLDLSKLESNELGINYIQNDVVKYLRYITESFHSLANTRNVMLVVDSREATIMMDYDVEKLRQILSNLLSNAIKYTPSTGLVLVNIDQKKRKALHHLPLEEAEEYLMIAVKDSGPGIPAEDLERIFDRFYQVDDALARTGGTGIGLALTQELVKLLGGHIAVDSELGEGSTFTIYLPIRREAPMEEVVTAEQASPVLATTTLTNKRFGKAGNQADRLLIVEDNPDVVAYLASCLENQYQLEFAYNGRAGIDKALESVPDIIVSDVMMPEKDGFELCDHLKNDEKTSHVPIVLLTAKADVESRISGLKRGADAYLRKPFNREELLVTLQNQLTIRKQLQQRYQTLNTDSNEINADAVKPAHQLEDAFIQKLRGIIEAHLDDVDFGIPQICRVIGMSRSQLHNKIKALTGLSTSIYIREIRLHKAKILLDKGEMNVSEVAYEVGFKDPSYFSRLFSEAFGYPPSEHTNN
ncbi:MAG: ATP-binding protein [Bacteroidota bacterium]